MIFIWRKSKTWWARWRRAQKGGRYGEATKAMRVPVSAIEHIEAFLEHYKLPSASRDRQGYHASGDVLDIMQIDMSSVVGRDRSF